MKDGRTPQGIHQGIVQVWNEMERLQKNQSKGRILFALTLGVLHKQKAHTSYQIGVLLTSLDMQSGERDGDLVSHSPLLEGVRIDTTAHAANTLIHYTPPPFDDDIVTLGFICCQAFS